jgi:hypothetical protein
LIKVDVVNRFGKDATHCYKLAPSFWLIDGIKKGLENSRPLNSI